MEAHDVFFCPYGYHEELLRRHVCCEALRLVSVWPTISNPNWIVNVKFSHRLNFHRCLLFLSSLLKNTQQVSGCQLSTLYHAAVHSVSSNRLWALVALISAFLGCFLLIRRT